MTILCQPAPAPDDLIPNLGADVRSVDDLDAALRALNDDPAEDLVVVGPEADAGDALRFAAELRLERPATGLILVREHVDVALLTEALRAGVREVVAAGDTVALVAACERSRTLSGRVACQRRAGTGTPAARSSRCSRPRAAAARPPSPPTSPSRWPRAAAAGSACVDLDLAFGDVAIRLQLVPARTHRRRACRWPATSTRPVPARCSRRYRPGLDTLLAPAEPGEAEQIPPALVAELLRLLRGMFDFVVVDTPPAVHRARAGRVRRLRPSRAADHAGHPGAEEPADHPGHARPAGLPARSRLVVLNRSDAKVGLTVGRRRAGAPRADRRRTCRPAGTCPLDQPRGADHAGQPAAPGQPGDPRLRARPPAQPGQSRAGRPRRCGGRSGRDAVSAVR